MAYSAAEIARFWPKVVLGGPDECWPWSAAKDRGYGMLGRDYQKPPLPPILAHRMAYEINKGPIPPGMSVLHKCDNPSCTNPAHLFLGTQQDNMADMKAKGRNFVGRGERNSSAKLTWDQVNEIRASKESQKALAKRYGLSTSTVCYIVNGKLWKQ